MMFILLLLLSALGRTLAPSLTTNISNTLWLISYSLISLIVMGCTLAGLIGVANAIIAHRTTSVHILYMGGIALLRKGIKNTGALLLIILGYNAILWIAYLIAFGIGHLLTLDVTLARIVFIFFLFIGLVSLLLFLTFTSFFLVSSALSIFSSMKSSIRLVKKEYLSTLALIVLFFVLGQLIEIFTGNANLLFKELINTLLLYPYLALCMMRFVHERASK